MMRVVIVISGLLGACGFSPTHDDVQADAQGSNGGPTIPLVACHSQLPDLRLCLDFEDPTLDPVIRDASVGGHDARSTLISSYPRAGQMSAAMDAGSVIVVPESPDLDIPQTITIEMWLNPDTTAPAWPLNNVGQYGLGIDSSELYCAFGTQSVHASHAIAVDTWTHVACSWDGTTVKAYVGGSVSNCNTSESPSTIPNVNGSGTAIGAGYFGAIDDVHVYARTLSATQIQALAGVTSGTTSCPD